MIRRLMNLILIPLAVPVGAALFFLWIPTNAILYVIKGDFTDWHPTDLLFYLMEEFFNEFP